MRTTAKLLGTAAAATLLLALIVAGAPARRVAFSETRWTAIWETLEPFVISEAGELAGPISCPLTLSGTFHSRTLSKVSGSLIGFVDRASVGTNSCVGGRATVLALTLPWHVRYDSFEGTLPMITAVQIQLVGVAIQIEGFVGRTCLYLTSAASPARAWFQRPGTTTGRLKPNRTATIPRNSGDLSCPSIRFEENGQGRVRAGNETSATLLTVTLVQ